MEEEKESLKTVFLLELDLNNLNENSEMSEQSAEEEEEEEFSSTDSRLTEEYDHLMQGSNLRPPYQQQRSNEYTNDAPTPGFFSRLFGGAIIGSCMSGVSSLIFDNTPAARRAHQLREFQDDATAIEDGCIADLKNVQESLVLNENDAQKHLLEHQSRCRDEKLVKIKTCVCNSAVLFRQRCSDIDNVLMPRIRALSAQLRTISETSESLRTEDRNTAIVELLRRGNTIMKAREQQNSSTVEDVEDVLDANTQHLEERQQAQNVFARFSDQQNRKNQLRGQRLNTSVSFSLTETANRLVTTSAAETSKREKQELAEIVVQNPQQLPDKAIHDRVAALRTTPSHSNTTVPSSSHIPYDQQGQTGQ